MNVITSKHVMIDRVLFTDGNSELCAEKIIHEWDACLRANGTVALSSIIEGLLVSAKILATHDGTMCKWFRRGIDYTISDINATPLHIHVKDRVTYHVSRSTRDLSSDHVLFHCTACVNAEVTTTIDFSFLIS